MPDPQTEERLRLLEAHVQVQEEVITALQAERIEAERLNEAVTSLGASASALGSALLQVDKNTRLVARLDKKLEVVSEHSATKEDLTAAKKEQAQTTLEFRKRTLERVYTTAIIMVLALLMIIGYVVDKHEGDEREVYAKCLAAAKSSGSVQEFVRAQMAIERGNTFVSPEVRDARLASLTQLGQAFPVPTCEEP